MERGELEDYLKHLEYEFSLTNVDDLVERGRLLIALNCAKEQLK